MEGHDGTTRKKKMPHQQLTVAGNPLHVGHGFFLEGLPAIGLRLGSYRSGFFHGHKRLFWKLEFKAC